MTSTSKSCHQNLVVFLQIRGNHQVNLHSDALPDSRVWLLTYLHFFQDNSFSMRSTSKWVGLQSGSQMGLLVLLIMPFLLTAVVAELSCCTKTTALGPGRSLPPIQAPGAFLLPYELYKAMR
uniref:Uncharacterized protein n=1 Tax=Xenopus tropicalis TaxID=8364 RepID=A0A6I8QQQ5_XENTR